MILAVNPGFVKPKKAIVTYNTRSIKLITGYPVSYHLWQTLQNSNSTKYLTGNI